MQPSPPALQTYHVWKGKTLWCYGWWEGPARSGMLALCSSQLCNGNKHGRGACTPLPAMVPSAPTPPTSSPQTHHMEKCSMPMAQAPRSRQQWWRVAASLDAVRTHASKGCAEVMGRCRPPASDLARGRGAAGPAPGKPTGHQPCQHPMSARTLASFPNLAAVLGCSSHPLLDK